ncbi:hypothetical protein UlMin_022717 [Ulmus minor]
MEVPLLAGESKEKTWKLTRSGLTEELKRVSYIAAPMVVVSISQNLLQVVLVMMAGHLGELQLSGVAIANSFTAITGFSLPKNIYFNRNFKQFGTYTYSSIISLTLVCFPVSLVWIFVEKLLVLIGQDPLVSKQAGKYSIMLIPTPFSCVVLQSLVRYFQCQELTFPLLLCTCSTLCLHIPVCWALVYKLELGITGAALSIGLSYWLSKTRVSFSNDVFLSIREFFWFGLPSAVMACLEWWSFELLILLSGILPNSKLETSVLSICLTTTTLHFFMPYGLGAAASTRVSNELGAGNPWAAQATVCAAMVPAVVEAVTVGSILFCCRSILGYTYSNGKEVVDYVAKIASLLSLSVIMDSLQAVLSGAYVNLGENYLVGIPLAIVLCFRLHLRGAGLWIGILAGSTVQALLLALITYFTHWQKRANEARERIFEQRTAENSLG